MPAFVGCVLDRNILQVDWGWKRGYFSPPRISATRCLGWDSAIASGYTVSARGNSIQHAREIKLLFASLPIAQFIYGKVVCIICFFCMAAGNLPVSKVFLTMLMMWERKNGENSRFPLCGSAGNQPRRPDILAGRLDFAVPSTKSTRTLGTRNQSF